LFYTPSRSYNWTYIRHQLFHDVYMMIKSSASSVCAEVNAGRRVLDHKRSSAPLSFPTQISTMSPLELMYSRQLKMSDNVHSSVRDVHPSFLPEDIAKEPAKPDIVSPCRRKSHQSTPTTSFGCQQCPKSFNRRENLSRHMKTREWTTEGFGILAGFPSEATLLTW
jgi:hypothetical protein